MSFRAWGPKQNGVYGLAVATSQTSVATPAGFTLGGNQVRIYNPNAAGSFAIVAFYKNASGAPTLAVPASGASTTPSGGRPDVTYVVVPGQMAVQVSISLLADSFASIGSAAGTAVLLIQKGDGST